uniref:Uncharacterized protein n=1 Tax=Globisporangium ultimum (strain ATCC 200006 / CBS 805.95 / DAOM BR144) TaxID=431595 RepID=K3WSZ2_GLOUD
MGLVLLAAAGGGVLLLLSLLVATSVVLVKLVLWLSLRLTLQLAVLAALALFVRRRRQCYAKGFYSCAGVPCAQFQTQTQHLQAIEEGEELQQSVRNDAKKTPVAANMAEQRPQDDTESDATTTLQSIVSSRNDNEDETVEMEPPLPITASKMLKVDNGNASFSATESEDDDDENLLESSRSTRSSTSSMSSAASPRRQPMPPQAPELMRARKLRPRSSSSSSGFSSSTRKRLMGDAPVTRSRHAASVVAPPAPSSSTSNSSSVRSRRAVTLVSSGGLHNKRNSFARRSGASERELMQEKLEADGYWIGDFRLERQLVPRRSFLGAAVGGNGSQSGNSSPRVV